MTRMYKTDATTDYLPSASLYTESFVATIGRLIRTMLDVRGHTVAAQRLHNRHALLRLVQAFWIDGVLTPAQQRVPDLALRVVDVQASVNRSTILPVSPESAGIPRSTLWQPLQYPLLILGEAGSGKTATLLEIARQLLSAAYQDPAQPLPVVLSLATWTHNTGPLAEWIVVELDRLYRIPKGIASDWLNRNELALLLDGLDEVAIQQQTSCLAAINSFIAQHTMPVVVNCETTAYQRLADRLNTQRAVMIQPLTPVEINSYLDSQGNRFNGLRSTLSANPDRLPSTPLHLQLLAGISGDQVATKQAQGHLQPVTLPTMVNAYTQSIASRSDKYSAAMITRSLTWLAKAMQAESQPIFAIEGLQPGWLPQRWQQWLYIYLSRTIMVGLVLLSTLLVGFGYLFVFASINQPIALFTGTANRLYNAGYTIIAILAAGLLVSLIDMLRHEYEQRTNSRGKVPFWGFLWSYTTATLLIAGPIIFVITLLTVRPLHPMGLWLTMEPRIGGVILLGITLGLLFWLIGGLRQIGQEIQFTGKARIAGRPILAGSVVGSTLFLLFTLTISGSSAIVAQIGQDDPLSYISSAWNAVHIMMAMLLLLIFIGWRIATINTTVIQITSHKSVFQAVRSSLLAPLLVTFGFTLGSTAVGSMIGVWFAAVRFFMHMGAALAVLLSLLFIPFIFLRYGGFTLIQHLCIRIILALGGYLPMRLVALLDYCVQIGLLYRIGGGYRFIHTVLQNHYAEIHK